MLDKLANQEHFCFLEGYSGNNQIAIAHDDREKTTFTCPFGTYAFRRIPFGLCNAPATFQRCMMAIFGEMVDDFVEVFMDDFSVYGSSFERCLQNLDRVLQRCEEMHLVLNWEKCHFLVTEGIVLGHKVSKFGLEVDRTKIEVISHLPPPNKVRGVKDKSDEAPILIAPDWDIPFELMCDASDTVVGTVLGRRKDKIFRSIYYAIKILDDAQLNYTVMEKEMLALVYAFDKFRAYLGVKISVADHLSGLENHDHIGKQEHIREEFPDEQLLLLSGQQVPCIYSHLGQ
ncbi:unnamed protein product [Withania somnifera]